MTEEERIHILKQIREVFDMYSALVAPACKFAIEMYGKEQYEEALLRARFEVEFEARAIVMREALCCKINGW